MGHDKVNAAFTQHSLYIPGTPGTVYKKKEPKRGFFEL
jgi:hypothetical protein